MVDEVRVFVDSLDGHSMAVLVPVDASVLHLKEKLFADTGIPIDRQRILYKAAMLQDRQLLRETLSGTSPKLFLVANLQYEANPIVRMTHSLILRNLRTYRRLRHAQAHSLSPEELLQVLTQHSLTINALIERRPMSLQLGQWVDVKDTVDQWLEAQVIDVQDERVHIHYNGWPARWDEWLPKNSPRIRPFRSVTVQAAGKPCKSPALVGEAQLQMACESESGLVQHNLHYLQHVLDLGKQASSTLGSEALAAFGQAHVASLDRIGRFMTDTAHLLASSKLS